MKFSTLSAFLVVLHLANTVTPAENSIQIFWNKKNSQEVNELIVGCTEIDDIVLGFRNSHDNGVLSIRNCFVRRGRDVLDIEVEKQKDGSVHFENNALQEVREYFNLDNKTQTEITKELETKRDCLSRFSQEYTQAIQAVKQECGILTTQELQTTANDPSSH